MLDEKIHMQWLLAAAGFGPAGSIVAEVQVARI